MKLKFLIKNGEKKYTLKENGSTKDAHYKFIKVRDAPKSDAKFVRKN
jgi:hypothetical protein